MGIVENFRSFASPSIRASKRAAEVAKNEAQAARSKRIKAAEEEATRYYDEYLQRRNYDAAKISQFNYDWHASGSSANAALIPAIPMLRNRSRDLVRNTTYGARAASIYVAMVAGIGFKVEPKTGNKKRDKAIADAWKVYSEDARLFSIDGSVNFNGHMMLAVYSMFESGEDITRIIPTKWKRGQKTPPVAFQGLEGDFFDTTKDGPTKDGGVIAGGVEKDQYGKPVAYHLYRSHPGDNYIYARHAFQSVRVPADEICHMFRHRRRHLNRGVPEFAPVILKMRDQMELQEARMMQQKIAAALAAFIETLDDPATKANGEVDGGTNSRIESIEPGQIGYLNIGESIKFTQPPVSNGGNEFNISIVKEIAVGLGIPYHMLSDDLSEANYSSYRAGMIVFKRLVEQIQEQTVIPMLCQPIFEAFCRAGVAAGLWEDGPFTANWTPSRFELIDPGKEIAAMKDAMRSGFMSYADCVASLGWDPEEKAVEISTWKKRFESLDIILDSDAGKTNQQGSIQGSPSVLNPSLTDKPKA